MFGPYSTNEIYVEDALVFMRNLPEKSVPMFLFSPPYNLGFSGKNGGVRGVVNVSSKWNPKKLKAGYDGNSDDLEPDEYTEWIRNTLRLAFAACSGAVFMVHKNRPLSGTLQHVVDFIPHELRSFFRQEIIWARPGGVNFSPSFFVPTHESIVILARPEWRLKSKGASGAGSVWRIAPEKNTWHPAPFPLKLAQTAIEAVMPSLVCDPFIGSGTVAKAAISLGVDFLGCDLSASYVERAKESLKNVQLAVMFKDGS